MSTALVEDLIIGTQLPYGWEIIQSRFLTRQQEGHWKNRQERIQSWVFLLLDGQKDHRRISEMLTVSEPEVRLALIELQMERLIQWHICNKEENMLDVKLLHTSFQDVKPIDREFAHYFYEHLFQRGRELFGTDEIKQLFLRRGTNMQKQYAALMGSLAYVITGVLENKHIEDDLLKLGARHQGYGVTELHYKIVGQCLIESLQWCYREKLHKEWTEALELTWTQAYAFVSGAMQKAGGA